MAPSNRTAPNIRKKRKVSGSAYGRPSLAPMNPDAHKITNNPGAAAIVKCSIGAIDDVGAIGSHADGLWLESAKEGSL